MKNLIHPIHNTMSLAGGSSASPRELSLLDCRVIKSNPTVIDGALVVFTNPIKAARYLEANFIGHDKFESTVLKTSEAMAKVIDKEKLSRLTIDPCPSCSWKVNLEVNDRPKLGYLMVEVIDENNGKVRFIKKRAEELIKKLDFEAALEMLQVAALHIDCSDPEMHYFIGICADKLKDKRNCDLALKNLQILDFKWWQKLKSIL